MQNHFNVEVMIVVFAVRAPLDSHVLLVIIEHLVELESSLELIRLSRHRNMIHIRCRLNFLESKMLRDLSYWGLLHSSKLGVTIS